MKKILFIKVSLNSFLLSMDLNREDSENNFPERLSFTWVGGSARNPQENYEHLNSDKAFNILKKEKKNLSEYNFKLLLEKINNSDHFLDLFKDYYAEGNRLNFLNLFTKRAKEIKFNNLIEYIVKTPHKNLYTWVKLICNQDLKTKNIEQISESLKKYEEEQNIGIDELIKHCLKYKNITKNVLDVFFDKYISVESKKLHSFLSSFSLFLNYKKDQEAFFKCISSDNQEYYLSDKDLYEKYKRIPERIKAEVLKQIKEHRQDIYLKILNNRINNKKVTDYKMDMTNIKQNNFINNISTKEFQNISLFNMKSYNQYLKKIISQNTNQKELLEEIYLSRFAEGLMPDGDADRIGEYIPYSEYNIQKISNSTDKTISHDWVKIIKEKKKNKSEIDKNDCFIDSLGHPVGYHAFTPLKSCNKIIIEVYGGNETKDLDAAYTSTLNDSIRMWNNKGYTFIRLNGYDLWDNDTFQGIMWKSTLEKILTGYKDFIQSLKKGEIQDLENLKNAQVFVKGVSFGGAIVTRLAQENPDLVNGVISINGVLRGRENEFVSFNVIRTLGENLWDHLWPYMNNKPLNVPILAMATTHDNRVPISNSIKDFYEKNPKNAKVYIHHNGNLEQDEKTYIQNGGVYIGHFLPEEEAFDVMYDFTEGKTPKELEDYRVKEMKIIEPINRENPSIIEESLLECYKLDLITKLKNKYLIIFEEEYLEKYFETYMRRAKTQKSFGYRKLASSQIHTSKISFLTKKAENEKKVLDELFVNNFKKHYCEIGFDEKIVLDFAKEKALKISWESEIKSDSSKHFKLYDSIICETIGQWAANREDCKKEFSKDIDQLYNALENLEELKRLETRLQTIP